MSSMARHAEPVAPLQSPLPNHLNLHRPWCERGPLELPIVGQEDWDHSSLRRPPVSPLLGFHRDLDQLCLVVAIHIAAFNNCHSLGTHETSWFWTARGKNGHVRLCPFFILSVSVCFYSLTDCTDLIDWVASHDMIWPLRRFRKG